MNLPTFVQDMVEKQHDRINQEANDKRSSFLKGLSVTKDDKAQLKILMRSVHYFMERGICINSGNSKRERPALSHTLFIPSIHIVAQRNPFKELTDAIETERKKRIALLDTLREEVMMTMLLPTAARRMEIKTLLNKLTTI